MQVHFMEVGRYRHSKGCMLLIGIEFASSGL